MNCIDNNVYVDDLLNYYDEGSVKIKRRKVLLKQIMQYVVFENNYDATMSDISTAIDIERKTLYRYFDSIDDIIVDLAYLLVTYNNQEYLKTSNAILNDKSVDSLDKLRDILKSVTNLMISFKSELNFLAYFDDQFNILADDDLAKKRYRNLITGFKTKNHYLRAVIHYLDNENILDTSIHPDDIIEVVEQVVNSFVSRTLKKENESYRFNVANIDVLIKILEKGIIKNNQNL